jgi:drug/metabolite transporter (DMT)-like permease
MTVPSVLLAVRFSVAFLVLNIVVLLGKGKIEFSLKGKPLKDILLLAIFQPVIYFFAESYGIAYTSSAFAGTIIAVVPIAGIICDILIMHVKVSRKQMICSVFSVIGVAITTLGVEGSKSSVLGIIMLFVAVMSAALFYVFSHKAGEYYNALERTYVMFAIGSVTFVSAALVQCAGHYDTLIIPAVTSMQFWGGMIYLSVFSSVLAFLTLNYGSYHIPVSQASIFANLTTVISIVAGVVILHERFTVPQMVGAAVILASVYISNVADAKEKGNK